MNRIKGKERPNFIDRAGEIWQTNEGYWIIIIDYRSCRDCDIQFNDERGTVLRNIEYTNIKKKTISNPYHRGTYDVGYMGVGDYDSSTHPEAYSKWSKMMQRCYSDKWLINNPTYKGCTVDEQWDDFQNFVPWFLEKYNEGFELDKDLIVRGNKIYSPETCCFIPKTINGLLSGNKKSKDGLPLGVKEQCGKYIVRCSVEGIRRSFGTYNTMEEASKTYNQVKECEIKRQANIYKEQLDPRAYEALMNWKIN